jgi:3-oxoacyl-[acyl-carrier protein] reductase
MNLKSRTALITGSGQNIGREIALNLARDGFNIVVNGISNQAAVEKTVAEVNALGVKSIGILADIGEPDGLSKLKDAALDKFG